MLKRPTSVGIPRVGSAGIQRPKGGGIARPSRAAPMKRRQELQPPDVPDPMDAVAVSTSDEAQQAKAVMGAAGIALAQRRLDEAKSMELTTDGRFYFVGVFDTYAQKEAFLKGVREKFGCKADGDIYIDLRQWADALGIPIPEVPVKMPGLFRIDRKYADLAMSDEDA